MKSLELLEELNRVLIDANKRCSIAFENVGEQDKLRSDIEHDILNNYKDMKAKDKREYIDKIYNCLVERHIYKYEYRELEILKELYNTPQRLESAFNTAINKLRKLNQELEEPIYYTRAKKNNGRVVIVKKEGTNE